MPSLRDFLSSIEVEVVREEVSPRLEIAARLRAGVPTLFESVKGHSGIRVAGNVCASRGLAAKALGVEVGELVHALLDASEHPRKYGLVDSAPFMENKVDEPDLIKVAPFVYFFEPHERYYATGTIVIAKDPETRRMNASFHRLMYLGGSRLAIRLVPRDLYSFYVKNREAGRDTRVAIVCGVHPAVALAAATSKAGLNELEMANALLRGRLECVDLDGLHVPAESEFVMVGRILKDEEADEGPIPDITGTWDAVRRQPVVEVERVYWRENAIWHVILPGGPEHKVLMGLPREPAIFRAVQSVVPTVKAVALTPGGCGWLHAVVSIKKLSEGDGKNAGIAALAGHPSLKLVIVVDDDVDVTDMESVEWALATRLDPSRGIVLIPGARASTLDPSAAKTGVTTKWIIDATIPLDRDRREFEKVV